jgi:DHA2 family multidrug resistance protein
MPAHLPAADERLFNGTAGSACQRRLDPGRIRRRQRWHFTNIFKAIMDGQTAYHPPLRLSNWLGYFAMCVGMFMAILDIQIVASSLPDIQSGLKIPFHALSWVQTAYLIAEIVAIPLTGWLTCLLSLRGLFLVAVTSFTLASAGCAASGSFAMLIVFRVLQGFSGGILIPIAFTAVFALFPQRLHVRATAVGGLMAMAAPMLGPAIGGYITETYSWPWLFLINVGPGIFAGTVGAALLRTEKADAAALERLDIPSLALFALALSALELGLKEAPKQGWTDPYPLFLFAVCGIGGYVAIRRCLARVRPLIDLRLLSDRCFAVGCFYSFVLGAALYGSVYLLPLFLGYVRLHTAFEIGQTMIVAGAVQLLTVPFVVLLVQRVDARLLTAVGFGLFALGLIANGFATYETDYAELFWPQVLRGAGVLLCLLPTTSMALEGRHGEGLANASGIFNLMRNLGGAIWIALIDTILEVRPPVHVADLMRRLHAGDPEAARFVGLPLEHFHGTPIGSLDGVSQFVQPLVERAAGVAAFNEGWLALGIFCAASLLVLPLLRRTAIKPQAASATVSSR